MASEILGVLTRGDGPGRRSHHPRPVHADPVSLEVALLRRGLAGGDHHLERCGRCARTLLLGERVYEYGSGALRCELCRERERQAPADSHTVHGPAFGHSIRVIDRRSRP